MVWCFRFVLLLDTVYTITDSFVGWKPQSLSRDDSCVGIWEQMFIFFLCFLCLPTFFPIIAPAALAASHAPLPQGRAVRITHASLHWYQFVSVMHMHIRRWHASIWDGSHADHHRQTWFVSDVHWGKAGSMLLLESGRVWLSATALSLLWLGVWFVACWDYAAEFPLSWRNCAEISQAQFCYEAQVWSFIGFPFWRVIA